jgi:hypothetical protein
MTGNRLEENTCIAAVKNGRLGVCGSPMPENQKSETRPVGQ